MFVDRVVEYFKDAVMKTAFIGVTDVHTRTLAHGVKAFEFIDLCCVVSLLCGNLCFGFLWLVRSLGHGETEGSKILPVETRNFVGKSTVFLPCNIMA
jgi:hypothetical protein